MLTKADERLDDHGRDKLLGLLEVGDPHGEVRLAWHAKEVVREIYAHIDPELGLEFVTRFGADLQDDSCPPELGPTRHHHTDFPVKSEEPVIPCGPLALADRKAVTHTGAKVGLASISDRRRPVPRGVFQ